VENAQAAGGIDSSSLELPSSLEAHPVETSSSGYSYSLLYCPQSKLLAVGELAVVADFVISRLHVFEQNG
jgi:hypothetical protein